MRNLALVCAALAVISTVISVNLWRELRAERQLTAQMRAQFAQGASAVASPAPALPQSDIAPGLAAGAGAAAAEQQAAAPADPAVAPPPPRAASSPFILNQRELLKDPEYRQAALAQARMNLEQNYPGLAEELGLAPEQADKLMDLLADLQLERNASAAITFTADGQLDPAAMDEMTRRNRELQQRQDEQISALLGSAGLQQFRAYEETRAPRMQAQTVRRMMESAGMPLTDAQMRPLTDVYIAEQRRQTEEMQGMLRQIAPAAGAARMQQIDERNTQLQEERNRRLLEVARGHLTAPQLERFEATLRQQLVMTQATSRMLRQQMEAQQRAQQGQADASLQGATSGFLVTP